MPPPRIFSAFQPTIVHVVSFADQEIDSLIKRQAYHIGVRADQLHDEASGNALDAVSPGLAAPLAGREIALDIHRGKPLEAHLGVDHLLTKRAVGRDEADARIDAMAAAREKVQCGRCLAHQFRLRQNPAADAHDGVGCENVAAFPGRIASDGGKRSLRLFGGQPAGERPRMLRALRRFVEVHGHQTRGLDPRLRQELDATRRSGRQYQFLGHCHRCEPWFPEVCANVMHVAAQNGFALLGDVQLAGAYLKR
ncbi:conserved hypothetical protein [Sinorhizobium medicae]|uniref:Uncharacterized protein n=1 Tax=Sinorhizobium medicae TaxID=110321 RepID=A0A508X2U6_9HYPH|nr:conserved hypothetical protein [Sinorhizobium medicae]